MLKLVRKTFTTTVIKFISAFISFFVISFLTNKFGATIYGAYMFSIAVFLLLNMLFRFGFDLHIQKKSAFKVNDSLKDISKLIFFSSACIFFISIIVTCGLFYFKNYIDPLKYNFLLTLIPFGFLYSIYWLSFYFFRGNGQGVIGVLITGIGQPLFFILGILGLSVFNFIAHFHLVGAYLFSILICIFFLFKNYHSIELTQVGFRFPEKI